MTEGGKLYDWMHGKRYPFIAKQVMSLVGKDAMVIDYGSLTGGVVDILRANGYSSVTPCEIKESVTDSGVTDVMLIDPAPAPLPFEDHSLDLIIFTDVIEHLTDPLPLLLDFKRVLKPGGVLLITTDNVFRIVFKIKYLLNINIFQDLDRYLTYPRYRLHHRQYSMAELKRLMTQHLGFRVVDYKYRDFVGSASPSLRIIERILYCVSFLIPNLRNTLYIAGCNQC